MIPKSKMLFLHLFIIDYTCNSSLSFFSHLFYLLSFQCHLLDDTMTAWQYCKKTVEWWRWCRLFGSFKSMSFSLDLFLFFSLLFIIKAVYNVALFFHYYYSVVLLSYIVFRVDTCCLDGWCFLQFIPLRMSKLESAFRARFLI